MVSTMVSKRFEMDFATIHSITWLHGEGRGGGLRKSLSVPILMPSTPNPKPLLRMWAQIVQMAQERLPRHKATAGGSPDESTWWIKRIREA